MDPILIVILIILAVVLVIGIFMVIECAEGYFQKDRSDNSSPSSPHLVGQHFAKLTDEIDVEAIYTEEKMSKSPNPLGGLFTHLHKGSQSLHAQGLCNHGGGAWGTVTSVSGRAATTNIWSPVSGGIYDSCQCEDNGGLH